MVKKFYNPKKNLSDYTTQALSRSQKGFTLAEIMVVAAIIAILSAAAAPAILNWLPNWRLKGAARDLYSTMQNARVDAIKNNQPRAILFNAANNTYSIHTNPGADGNWNTVADNTVGQVVDLTLNGVRYGHGNIPAGQALAPEPPAAPVFPANDVDYPGGLLIFNSNGTINPGPTNLGYVYLQNQDNISVFAIGARASGVIMIRRWMGGTW